MPEEGDPSLPPVATKLFRPKLVTATRDGSLVGEAYLVSGLPHGDADSWIGAVPNEGTDHPRQDLYPGAKVYGYQLLERVNFTAVKGLVLYRSNFRYSGGPQPISKFYTTTENGFTIPIIRERTSPTGPTFYEVREMPFPRVVGHRVETRFLADDPAVVQSAIFNNIGSVYTFNNIPYLLEGGDATTNGFGLTRVSYYFRISMPTEAVPANNSFLKNSVAIPALPANGQFAVDDTVSPPEILVVEADVLSGTGGTLPGL
jgi:hypothetical protein